MENLFLSALVREITPKVVGRRVAKIGASDSTIVIDAKLPDKQVLIASVSTDAPALYLSSPRSFEQTQFALLLRRDLSGARIISISKKPADRIVTISFEVSDAKGERLTRSLQLSLTGRSANAFLIEASGTVTAAMKTSSAMAALTRDGVDLREMLTSHAESITESEALERLFGAGTPFGPQIRNEFVARCHQDGSASPAEALKSLARDLFERPPVPLVYARFPLGDLGRRVTTLKSDLFLSHIELEQASGLIRQEYGTLSEAANAYYTAVAQARAFQSQFAAIRQHLAREMKKRETAVRACEADLARLGKPAELKRRGELILANLANARLVDGRATLIDYFDEGQRTIDIEIAEGQTLKEAAAEAFAQYQRATRALPAVTTRLRNLRAELESLQRLQHQLDDSPTEDVLSKVELEAGRTLKKPRALAASRGIDSRGSKAKKRSVPIGRRFRSTDGYEVVVGRNDRDNDAITFKVAKPQDLWLHAADYPGSHVLVRNPTRQAVPHRTIVEAAELAAFYSQAGEQRKAAVHYTPRKFVSKPPRSKAGLVRLSSFKTVMVEPKCVLDRIE